MCDVARERGGPTSRQQRRLSAVGHIGKVAAVVALVGLVTIACNSGNGAVDSAGTVVSSTTEPVPSAGAPSTATPVSSEACAYLAATIGAELARWTGSEDIVTAPIAETRLGPQPEDGVPGVLVDGCVWEARGPVGGHIGVALERYTSVDMDALESMAAAESIGSNQLTDGRMRWDVPAGETPSGAVIIGDGAELVVVRVESYSDDDGRTFLAEAQGGSDRFFSTIGDAVAAS